MKQLSILLLILFCFSSTAFSEDTDALKVDIEQILGDYKDNELAASYHYKGKKVNAVGIANKISSNSAGIPYVMLATSDRGTVFCFFARDHIKALMELKSGQDFSATCNVKGLKYSDSLELENCTIN